MAVDGLAWLPFQVNLWTGHFGATPSYFGAMDTNLQNKGAGRTTLGDGDADIKYTSAGTLLLVDLNFVVNGGQNKFQLGVNVTRCPAGATRPAAAPPPSWTPRARTGPGSRRPAPMPGWPTTTPRTAR